MRNMSFALTTPQMRARTKTVTRRAGWRHLKPGDMVMACEKTRGLAAGELDEKKIAPIVITSVRREPLNAITDADVVLEGFPHNCRRGFVTMFVGAMGGHVDQVVTRIEFRFVPGGQSMHAATQAEE